jgi:hypothetical protein
MSRMRTFFSIVLPSALAGGVLFGSAFSRADAGMQVGFWPDDPAATVVAQASPDPHPNPHPHPHPNPTVVVVPPVPPIPPLPPIPAMPAMPPMPMMTPEVIRQMQQEIQNAIEQVRNTKELPPATREKIIHKLEKLRDKTTKRLAHIKPGDYEKFGEEMGKIGEDIGEEMGDLGDELGEWAGQWGQQLGQQIGQQLGQQLGNLGNLKFQFGPNANAAGPNGMHIHINGGQTQQSGDDDDDDDDDDSSSGNAHTHVHAHAAHGHNQDANDNANDDNDADNDNDSDNDNDVDTDVVVDLGDLSLQPPQRDQIQQLRANSQRQIEQARRQLQQASEALQQALDNVNASDEQLAHAIDAVSQQEATIRKAKIIAWHDARRVLDGDQRKRVEAASAKTKQRSK